MVKFMKKNSEFKLEQLESRLLLSAEALIDAIVPPSDKMDYDIVLEESLQENELTSILTY